jgi:hypothetical protein
MLMHYAHIWHVGGFFSEDEYRPVAKRDPALVSLDGRAYAFSFVDREESEIHGKLLKGEWENKGPRYIKGEIYDEARVRAEVPNSTILLDNMRCNRWSRVIKCKQGFLPLEDSDVALAP